MKISLIQTKTNPNFETEENKTIHLFSC